MSEFRAEDAGFNVGVNVRITKRNKDTGRVIETREGHNKCLRTTLLGIAKYLNGEFNPTQPHLYYYDWIPRYLGLGTNEATIDNTGTVTSTVNINDTRLLSELSPRIKLNDTNTVVNRSSNQYVQVVISTYLPEHLYNDEEISEAGLFSKASGNNCLFRIVFDPIKKTQDSVIEVNWTISIISVDSANEPYEEINKEDLYKAMQHLIDRMNQLYPDFTESNQVLEEAILEYGRTDSTAASVQAMSDRLAAEVYKMALWVAAIDPLPVIEKVDDINGEEI